MSDATTPLILLEGVGRVLDTEEVETHALSSARIVIAGSLSIMSTNEPTGDLDSTNGEAVTVHLFDDQVVRDERGEAAAALEHHGFEVS